MKEIWTLIIKTSLPSVCPSASSIKTEVLAFEKFEDAKALLREKLRGFAFSENAMFNGKGQITEFNKYMKRLLDEEEFEVCDGFFTKNLAKNIEDALYEVFSGKDTTVTIEEGSYNNGLIAFEYKDGIIKFFGDYDGPINGYDPTLFTNMFDMTEEKDYFLYIDDMFGQDDFTSELYIDIKKTKIS